MPAVSGPITLYDVAGDAGAKGTTYFVWAMAGTSVNLGLINLLPIPILDGGHLLVFAIEAARRRPLSTRMRERVQNVGFIVVILIIALATRNDLMR